MNQTKIIAQTLTNEVMDENYRGTPRINKHGETRSSKNNSLKKISRFIGKLFKKYLDYYGNRD